jgi:Uma2 family endonuclease
VLVVSPFPTDEVAGMNEWLGCQLISFQTCQPAGTTFDATLPGRYVQGNNSRRRADRLVWAGLGRQPRPRIDPPTIIVEFVSRGRRNRERDFQTKRTEYLGLGVQEYWIFDRFQRRLTVCRPNQADQVVGEADTYRTPHLPGFELPVGQILAVADRWRE